jgi:hypothetical protein
MRGIKIIIIIQSNSLFINAELNSQGPITVSTKRNSSRNKINKEKLSVKGVYI